MPHSCKVLQQGRAATRGAAGHAGHAGHAEPRHIRSLLDTPGLHAAGVPSQPPTRPRSSRDRGSFPRGHASPTSTQRFRRERPQLGRTARSGSDKCDRFPCVAWCIVTRRTRLHRLLRRGPSTVTPSALKPTGLRGAGRCAA
jgi:hypothetical protein